MTSEALRGPDRRHSYRRHGCGIIKQGIYADVAVFDPATITDRATFDNPNQFSTGMRFVPVNGEAVISEGQMTNKLPGQVLRHAQ